jgi:hypothetical protein
VQNLAYWGLRNERRYGYERVKGRKVEKDDDRMDK